MVTTLACLPARLNAVDYRQGQLWQIGHLPALDGLRGVAIALVVINHLDIQSTQTLGVVGVTAFFVISGFLITSLLVREWQTHSGINLRLFYARRIKRLFPALLVLLIVVAAVDLFNRDTGHIVSHVAPALLYYYNWIPANMAVPDPLAQMWSLSVEEQFYLLWPVLLLATLRHRGIQWAFCVAAIVAAAALIDRGLLVDVLHSSIVRIYFGSDANAFALMAGCGLALALCLGRVPRVERSALACICVAVAFIVATASPNGADLFLLLGPVIVTVATALLIARLVTVGGGGVLTWRPMRGLGRISYSLYLWQTPVIVWGNVWLGSTPLVVRVALLTSLSLACACVSYRYVEAPLRDLGRTTSPSPLDATVAPTSPPRALIGSV